jgi:hypothetical protein
METLTQSTELIRVVESSGVEQQTANLLIEKFVPFFENAKVWREKAEGLVVTSITQKREMQEARLARLALRDIRIQADKTRKILKEDSNRYGKAVQGVYNVIESVIVPIEEHLEKQERFEQILLEQEREAIKKKREDEIQPYLELLPLGIDVTVMHEDHYQKMLVDLKQKLHDKIEAEKKAEEERILAERKKQLHNERKNVLFPVWNFMTVDEAIMAGDLGELSNDVFNNFFGVLKKRKLDHDAEQERLRLENERLNKEREQLERKRKEAEEKLAQEQREKARLEAEAKAKADAEERAKREEQARVEEQKRKALLAPDKDKLLEYAARLRSAKVPEVTSPEAKAIADKVRELLDKIANYIDEKSATI